MDKKTLRALKIVLKMAMESEEWSTKKDNAVAIVRDWIKKIAKKYK